jgi:uncharacterized protein (DUF2236 family)|tara:strand:- start:349 stop:597 length:249 start_codon:yes stop_codon:yes gene_type:complete
VVDNERNVINIAGTEYDPNDLTDQQKYWIRQLQDLQNKRQAQQFQLDQTNVALDSFMNALIGSFKDPETAELFDDTKEEVNG